MLFDYASFALLTICVVDYFTIVHHLISFGRPLAISNEAENSVVPFLSLGCNYCL